MSEHDSGAALLLKNLFFTLVVPGTVAVVVPWRLASESAPASGVLRGVAAVLFGAGAATYGRCLWDFAVFGRGTPAPIDAPKRLVVRGLYRWTRNPMYVGVLSVILGWAVLHRSTVLAAYATGIAASFHLFVVFYEEPRLRREFGAGYERYAANVPRWFPRAARRAAQGENRGASDP